MNISENGLNLIKKFEGCKLSAYKCPAGVWTIGYGHTTGVKQGQTITQEQADAYLKADCANAEKNVNLFMKKYGFNQNEFDALVSFAVNIGSINQLTGNGTRSLSEISAKIPEYNKAGGKVLQGLINRRAAEKALFDTPVQEAPEPGKDSVTDTKKKAKTYKGQVTAKSGLNVRKEADSESGKLGAIKYGTIVTVKKEQKGWGKITVMINNKSVTGWVYLQHIKRI